MKELSWVAVDWGTTQLRCWAMSNANTVCDSISVRYGLQSLNDKDFKKALLHTIAPWLGKERIMIVACGMVGAREGWVETPYVHLPYHPGENQHMHYNTRNEDMFALHVLAGVRQEKPADVMRGEETQIAGFLRTEPSFEGIICLPGTHSKWVLINQSGISRFTTCMTGELFSLLERNSVLRYSLLQEGLDNSVFCNAVKRAFSSPEKLLSSLFAIRSRTLLHNTSSDCARAELSGLLLGTEFAAVHSLWKNQPLVVIGTQQLGRMYTTALTSIGKTTQLYHSEHMTLQGLSLAHSNMRMAT